MIPFLLIPLFFLLLVLITILAFLAVASALISILALRLSLMIAILVLAPFTLHNSQLTDFNHGTILELLVILMFLTRMLSAMLLLVFCFAIVFYRWLT